jgi:hypothetical protein
VPFAGRIESIDREGMAVAIQKYRLGVATTLLSSGLDGLGQGHTALSGEFDNTQGQSGDGAALCDVELVWGYGAAISTGSVTAWFLGSLDGTSYEDGTAGTPGTTPARAPDVVFVPRYSVTTPQRQVQRVVLPAGKFKVLVKNDQASQAFAAAGNTLKLRPVALEVL